MGEHFDLDLDPKRIQCRNLPRYSHMFKFHDPKSKSSRVIMFKNTQKNIRTDRSTITHCNYNNLT